MFVGVCRLSFHLPGNHSLKGKRSIVRRLIDRTRIRFNAAVAEVADNDRHEVARIGVCVVGNSASHVDSMLNHIAVFMEQLGVAVPAGRQTEVIAMGDEFGEQSPFPVPEEVDAVGAFEPMDDEEELDR